MFDFVDGAFEGEVLRIASGTSITPGQVTGDTDPYIVLTVEDNVASPKTHIQFTLDADTMDDLIQKLQSHRANIVE